MKSKKPPLKRSIAIDDVPLFAHSDKQLRAEYDANLFEMRIYQTLSQARDIPELKRMLLDALQRLGFSDYSFIQLNRREEVETHLYTTPDEFPRIYLGEGIYEHDLVLSYAAVNTEPIYQSTIDEFLKKASIKTENFFKNELIQRHVKAAGFLDYYNIPIPATTGQSNALLSITAKNVDPKDFARRAETHKNHLHILCKAVDYVGTLKFPHLFLDNIPTEIKIFPKPLRLLTLLAKEDVTLQEAADIMGITRSTANAHVAAIKEALSTKTLWGSVFKASQLGLIEKKP